MAFNGFDNSARCEIPRRYEKYPVCHLNKLVREFLPCGDNSTRGDTTANECHCVQRAARARKFSQPSTWGPRQASPTRRRWSLTPPQVCRAVAATVRPPGLRSGHHRRGFTSRCRPCVAASALPATAGPCARFRLLMLLLRVSGWRHRDPFADETFTASMRINLQRLIMYAKGSDVMMQREVAEQLANQAVKRALALLLVRAGSATLCTPRALKRCVCNCCRCVGSRAPGADCGAGRVAAAAASHKL